MKQNIYSSLGNVITGKLVQKVVTLQVTPKDSQLSKLLAWVNLVAQKYMALRHVLSHDVPLLLIIRDLFSSVILAIHYRDVACNERKIGSRGFALFRLLPSYLPVIPTVRPVVKSERTHCCTPLIVR